MKHLLTLLLLMVLLAALFSINASAYLDPSAVTYIIQAVAGVLIAGGATMAIYWKKIKIAIKKRKEKKKDTEQSK